MVFARQRERETGDPIDTTQQVPVARMQTQRRPHRCFVPALSAYLRPPTKLCRSGPAGGGSSGDEAVSLVVCSVDWSVCPDLVSYVCMVRTRAAILNGVVVL